VKNYRSLLGEYAQMLCTESDDTNESIAMYTSIHGISLTEPFSQQILNKENHFSYDFISILELQTLSADKTSHPHTFISLDRLTPLTIGRIISETT
jgi:hypothetical protein